MREIRFDDIEALKRELGGDFSPWGESLEVSQAMIDSFAELTSDQQWIHTDLARAERGPFGGTIAHGFLVLSLLPAVRPPSDFIVTGHRAVSNFGIDALSFLSPLPAGESIRAHSRLLDVSIHRRGTLLTNEVALHRVGTDRPLLTMHLQLLYMG